AAQFYNCSHGAGPTGRVARSGAWEELHRHAGIQICGLSTTEAAARCAQCTGSHRPGRSYPNCDTRSRRQRPIWWMVVPVSRLDTFDYEPHERFRKRPGLAWKDDDRPEWPG